MGIASEPPGNRHRKVHVSKPGRKTKKLAVPCDGLLGGWGSVDDVSGLGKVEEPSC